MNAMKEKADVRELFFALGQYMRAAKRVTRRNLEEGTTVEAARFKRSKENFQKAKDALLETINQIDAESELGKNVKLLFESPGFGKIIDDELAVLRDEKTIPISGNGDAVQISKLHSEKEILDFEMKVLSALNFPPLYLQRLKQEEGQNG